MLNEKTYLQYLHTDGLPFPRSNIKSMSRALLLLTTGLIMGATRVVSSPDALAPPAGAARALAGAGGVSSSSEVSETLISIFSSTGVGKTGARWTGAGTEALDRERGAMLGMCIEDVASPSYIQIRDTEELIERTHLIDEYTNGHQPFQAISQQTVFQKAITFERGRKNLLDRIEA